MRVINKHQRDAHEEMKARILAQHEEHLKHLDSSSPQSFEVTQHPKDQKPKTLDNGSVVMAGDYYTNNGVVIAARDIGENGSYEEVKEESSADVSS